MEVKRGEDEGAAAEAFAQKLMDAWGVGDAACNDGVVLFVSQEPRKVPSAASLAASVTLMPMHHPPSPLLVKPRPALQWLLVTPSGAEHRAHG